MSMKWLAVIEQAHVDDKSFPCTAINTNPVTYAVMECYPRGTTYTLHDTAANTCEEYLTPEQIDAKLDVLGINDETWWLWTGEKLTCEVEASA